MDENKSQPTLAPENEQESEMLLQTSDHTQLYNEKGDRGNIDAERHVPLASMPKLEIWTIFVCVVLIIATTTMLIVDRNGHKSPHRSAVQNVLDSLETGDCGPEESIAGARDRGCIFDPMSFLWVKPACYHGDLIEDFMNRTDWHFYRNWTMTPEDEITKEELYEGIDQIFYTTDKFHHIHCTYMWKKMHKILANHLPIDDDLADWHHTEHCERVLLNGILHEYEVCIEGHPCPTVLVPHWAKCEAP